MEESIKKAQVDGGDREILYSKAIKAGQRVYYLDVKRNLKDDLFVAVTESKKVQSKDGGQVSFEKHKIFLYKEDFEKFMVGMNDVINYIHKLNAVRQQELCLDSDGDEVTNNMLEETEPGEIRLDIEF